MSLSGRFTVIVTGGTLRRLQHSLVNPMATMLLDSLRADIGFIGCNGVDAVHGVTNLNLPEAEVKQRMIATAERTVVVADGSALAAEKLERVLTTDPAMGVLRHVDAGYERAAQVARERGVHVPMLAAEDAPAEG